MQCLNIALVFVVFPFWEGLEKPPDVGTHEPPGENQWDVLVTYLGASHNVPLSMGCIQRDGLAQGDSESSDSVFVWVHAGVRCHAQGYHSAELLPWICWE